MMGVVRVTRGMLMSAALLVSVPFVAEAAVRVTQVQPNTVELQPNRPVTVKIAGTDLHLARVVEVYSGTQGVPAIAGALRASATQGEITLTLRASVAPGTYGVRLSDGRRPIASVPMRVVVRAAVPTTKAAPSAVRPAAPMTAVPMQPAPVVKPAPTTAPLAASVTRINPLSSSVSPGRQVTLTLEGNNLNALSAVRILQAGKDAAGFRATLEPPSAGTQTRRRVTVQAATTSAPGSYQLVLFAGRQSVAVPRGTTLAVAVPATAAPGVAAKPTLQKPMAPVAPAPTVTGVRPAPATTKQPTRRAMVIVVEENETQSESVTWVGISEAISNVNAFDLLPPDLRNVMNGIAQTVDPILQPVAQNVPPVLDYVSREMHRLMLGMLADWVGAAAPMFPNANCAREMLTTLRNQGLQTGEDAFKVFTDRYGEPFLGNCLREMARPFYDRVELLTDAQATFQHFDDLVTALDRQGYVIDLVLDVHGCGIPNGSASMLNNGSCSGGLGFVGTEPTPNMISLMNAGEDLTLNAVYMVSCWGSNYNQAWLELGAKASNGARELNYHVLLSPIVFMDQFTRGQKSLAEAAQIAYQAERTLFDGKAHTVTLDLRPFLDQYFPRTTLDPFCPGVTFMEQTVGMSYQQDGNGIIDTCVPPENTPLPTTEAVCPPAVPGHQKVERPGTDACVPIDVVGGACPGGSRDGCQWSFDLGIKYGDALNRKLGELYGYDSTKPVNAAVSSERLGSMTQPRVGNQESTTVFARVPSNHTGIRLQAGRQYELKADDSEWVDGAPPLPVYRSNADGYTSPNPVMQNSEQLRRAPSANWFELVCKVGNSANIVIGKERTLTAPMSGELMCFANDVATMYGNNSGAIGLTVRRLN